MPKSIIEKIIQIQKDLKAPKNQRNNFGKYNYRSLEDILEAVKPLLAKHGLLLTLSDEMDVVGDRNYLKATAIITDGENEHRVTALAREDLNHKAITDGAQLTGACSSYARKCALNGLFLIDDTKDADAQEPPKEEKKPKKTPASKVPSLDEFVKQEEEARKKIDEGLAEATCDTDIEILRETLRNFKWVQDSLKSKMQEYFKAGHKAWLESQKLMEAPK